MANNSAFEGISGDIGRALRSIEKPGVSFGFEDGYFVAKDSDSGRFIAKSRTPEGLEKNLKTFEREVSKQGEKFQPFRAIYRQGYSSGEMLFGRVTSAVNGETPKYGSSVAKVVFVSSEGKRMQVAATDIYVYDAEIEMMYEASQRACEQAKARFVSDREKLAKELKPAKFDIPAPLRAVRDEKEK